MIDALLDAISTPAAITAAETALTEALTARGIYFGDGLLPTYCVPFFAREEELSVWRSDAEELARRVESVAQAALRDPAMMRTLHLRPDARAWVEIDPGYDTISVLARPDAIFLDGRIRYVEYNSDSPAMMAFSDHVAECLLELPHLRGRGLRGETQLPRLLDTLLDCFRAYGGSGSPTIAIADWPGQKTRYEHARIAEYFESRGCPTVICDPRALTRPGRKLELDGRTIDLVYRRALFTELLDKQREIEPLVSAYRDGAVCMVNPLRSYLASSKTLLAHLCDAWGPDCPVLPTRILHEARVAELRQGPITSVIKKGESHGGLHVLLPGLFDEADRQAALDDALREPWIEQEYAPLPKLRVPSAGQIREKFYNWNPFLFGLRYAGAIARASDTPLINITLGGGLLPTVTVPAR